MKNVESLWLSELKRGDHSSFRKIFDLYSKPLYLFSYSWLKSREGAEDVVQEVFMKVWNNRNELRRDTSFRSYLFTIAVNALRHHFNRLTKINELKHNILADFVSHKNELDTKPGYQDLLDKLYECIEQMPEKRKQVFIKKKLEEKSLKEISDECEITVKTVEYHITEAMKYLKQEFEKLNMEGLVFFYLFIQQNNF